MSLVLTADEVARALGVSAKTVYAAVRRGEIPNVGIGRAVRIPRTWLDGHLDDGDVSEHDRALYYAEFGILT